MSKWKFLMLDVHGHRAKKGTDYEMMSNGLGVGGEFFLRSTATQNRSCLIPAMGTTRFIE